MYMGVILSSACVVLSACSAPHVYGGDPIYQGAWDNTTGVLPMYMGVIPFLTSITKAMTRAPHVYGGDPPSVR